MMKYNGYLARVDFDERDSIFVGRVLGIADEISFHGASVKELKKEFHAAIDHYIDDCRKAGREPLKPASGRILLRVPPEMHAKAAVVAEAQGKSLNQWLTETIEKAAASG